MVANSTRSSPFLMRIDAFRSFMGLGACQKSNPVAQGVKNGPRKERHKIGDLTPKLWRKRVQAKG
jgi:hypothetical protein